MVYRLQRIRRPVALGQPSTIESWYAAERAQRGNWHAACHAQTHWGYCCPHHRVANAFAAHADVVVYYYWFRHHTLAGKWAFLNTTGVPHGSEQAYVLHDNTVLQDGGQDWYPTFTAAEWTLSQLMGEVWLAHGTHGDPNRAAGLGVTWPRYTGDSGAGGVLAFDVGTVEVVPYPERAFCTHWPSGLDTPSP